MDGNVWLAGSSKRKKQTQPLAWPSASCIILIAAQGCETHITLTSDIIMWHCRFHQGPPGIYHPYKHILRPALLASWKQGSDWMTSCCRYSSLLKSIFPTAALAPAALLLFPHCPQHCPPTPAPVCPVGLVFLGGAVGSTLECSDLV